MAVGSQWGQFDHHWSWGTTTDGPGSDHSGSGSLWGNRLNQNYSYFENSYLESPIWDLGAVISATVTFWHWLETEWCTSGCGSGNPTPTALDGGRITCWDGSSWALAVPVVGYAGTIRIWDSAITPDHPLKNEPGFLFDPSSISHDASWRQIIIELPTECLRSDARIRLRFGADSSSSSLNGQGWYFDDIEVVGTCS